MIASFYAHPLTLVMQHKRLPANFPDRLPNGAPMPTYETSGWCTFESECAKLASEGGGMRYELGPSGGWLSQRREARRSPEEMRAVFLDETRTRFVGKGDRKVVGDLYHEYYSKVLAYDEKVVPFVVRFAEANRLALATCKLSAPTGQKCRVGLLLLLLLGWPSLTFLVIVRNMCAGFWIGAAAAIATLCLWTSVLLLPSRVVRASLGGASARCGTWCAALCKTESQSNDKQTLLRSRKEASVEMVAGDDMGTVEA